MRIVTQLIQEETFTFEAPGEPVIHIRSGKLREWLLANAMDKVVDLHFPEQTLDEIVEMHGLEEPRIRSMRLKEAKEPVIVGLQPHGTHILIDGGHRRHYWAKRGKTTLRGWAVPYAIWNEFRFNPNDYMVVKHHADGSMLPQRRAK